MRSRKLFPIATVATLWGLLACAGRGTSADVDAPRWTVVCYVCGDAEDKVGESTEALFAHELREEVAKAGIKDAVVGALFDRMPGADDAGIPSIKDGWTEARLLRLKASGDFADEGRLGIVDPSADENMGDPATLKAFLAKSIPWSGTADRLALVLCGHGTGYEVCQDGSNDRRALSLAEIRDTLTAATSAAGGTAPRRIALLAYYACNMATLEVALTARASCDYLLACQEEVDSVHGWDCSALAGADLRPDVVELVTGRVATAGLQAVPGLAAAYHAIDYGRAHKTMSLSKLTGDPLEQLRAAVELFAEAALAACTGPEASRVVAELHAIASKEGFFVHTPASDLGALAAAVMSRLVPPSVPEDTGKPLRDRAAEILRCLALVSTPWNGSDRLWAHGLSILRPVAGDKDIEHVESLGVLPKWVGFAKFLSTQKGTQLVRHEVSGLAPFTPPAVWRVTSPGSPRPAVCWLSYREDAGGPVRATVPFVEATSPSSPASEVAPLWGYAVPIVFDPSVGAAAAPFPVMAVRGGAAAVALEVSVAAEWRRGDSPPLPMRLDLRVTRDAPGVTPEAGVVTRATALLAGDVPHPILLAKGDRLRPAALDSLRRDGIWTARPPQLPADEARWKAESVRVGASGIDGLRVRWQPAPAMPIEALFVTAATPSRVVERQSPGNPWVPVPALPVK